MSLPFSTILLDVETWDFVIDSNANVARADPPYALAQDVASAIKTFLDEVWYDTTLGIPYFQQILGMTPPIPIFVQYLIASIVFNAQNNTGVPGVVSAQVLIQSFDATTGAVKGQVLFVDVNGNQQSLTI